MSQVSVLYENGKRYELPVFLARDGIDSLYQLIRDIDEKYYLATYDGYQQKAGPWNSIEEFMKSDPSLRIVDVDIKVKRR